MRPDIRFHPSAFGGGWFTGETPKGREHVFDFLGAPEWFDPIHGDGYIAKPYEVTDFIDDLRQRGCEVVL